MKKLFAALFLTVALSAFAQNPSYKQFDQQYFTTNSLIIGLRTNVGSTLYNLITNVVNVQVGGAGMWQTNALLGGMTNVTYQPGRNTYHTNDFILLGSSRFIGNGLGITNIAGGNVNMVFPVGFASTNGNQVTVSQTVFSGSGLPGVLTPTASHAFYINEDNGVLFHWHDAAWH